MPGPVAVVGAAGFLGRALVEALRRSTTGVSAYTRSVPFLGPDGAAAPGLASARTVFWLATQINPQIAEQQPLKVAEDRAAFDAFLHLVQDPHRFGLGDRHRLVFGAEEAGYLRGVLDQMKRLSSRCWPARPSRAS